MIENKFFGNKSGKGYYEKTKEKDDNGRSVINALDLETNEYRNQLSLIYLKSEKQSLSSYLIED